MVRRQPADLVGLTVLGLLLRGPRHPYELHRLMVDTHGGHLTASPDGLHHAVDRLMNDELIVPVEVVGEDRRLDRTVYRITADGRAELVTRLRGLLERSDGDRPSFTAAVSLLGCLPVADAVRCLGTRVAGLEGRIATLEVMMGTLRGSGLPRLQLLELEYIRASTTAELQWVRDLLADIRAGDLVWASPPADADVGDRGDPGQTGSGQNESGRGI